MACWALAVAGCGTLSPTRCLPLLLTQGEWQLHWPLVNSPALRERIARRELELKRQEDADRWGGGGGEWVA